MKGTDQAGSLGPDGVNRMVRDIRVMDLSIGREEIFISEGAQSASYKLERSIATNRAMVAGEIISENDIHLLSPGDGFKWTEKDKVLGKILRQDIGKDEVIYSKDMEK